MLFFQINQSTMDQIVKNKLASLSACISSPTHKFCL